MRNPVWREVWLLLFITAGGGVFGALWGQPLIGVIIALLIYVASRMMELVRLHRWLLTKKRGEIPEAAGFWGDVFQEIRQLERQAARREDRLTSMVTRFQNAAAAMPDAVAIITANDEIEWANAAAAKLLGLQWPRDTGRRVTNLIREPAFARYLQRADFREPMEMESPVTVGATIAVQLIPFGSKQTLIIGRDVSRVTRLEQIRRFFVANVSHELRTPITVLVGYLETLKDDGKADAAELQRHIDTMYEQAVRMQRLVDDLLALSKLETTRPKVNRKVVDISRLLDSLAEQGKILSGDSRHRITTECLSEMSLKGDKEELFSAFMNLLTNAIRYTPANGAITLTWQVDAEGGKLSVSDTGEGVAPDQIPRLTERFYRVDTARSRASGGTGLGLSIVKHVLLRHDARLDVTSKVGKGSVFTCVFPPQRVTAGAVAEDSSAVS